MKQIIITLLLMFGATLEFLFLSCQEKPLKNDD